MLSLHKIYSEDALELDAILFKPKKKTDKIIIHVHGKEGHFIQNHFVSILGNSYSKAGYAFLTFNNRGHDYMADMLKKSTSGFQWVKKGTAFDRISEFKMDINGVLDYVSNLGYKHFILQGHSIGPHKICHYLAHNPKHKVQKVILLSPGDIFYLISTFIQNWQKHSKKAQTMIKKGLGEKIMEINLWNDAPVSASSFWDYTKPNSETWMFNYSNPEKEFSSFNQITQPVLAVFPDNEFSINVTPKKALEMLKKRSVSKSFSSFIIPNTIHNFMGQEALLAKKIIHWLKS